MKTKPNKHNSQTNQANKLKSPFLFRKIIAGVSMAKSNKLYAMSGALVHQPDRDDANVYAIR